jgi:hypothetical protein
LKVKLIVSQTSHQACLFKKMLTILIFCWMEIKVST